jgi:hypothetical protein
MVVFTPFRSEKEKAISSEKSLHPNGKSARTDGNFAHEEKRSDRGRIECHAAPVIPKNYFTLSTARLFFTEKTLGT